ncbi:MAG: family 10 glycosylhydrolase, partial [Phaeodactylibacter sp.]|nr:family 10 glycosylhydrolase [Phaeodactylibacter sp.]
VTEKNGFQWMNPFHPEVQDFIKGLVLEVVRNYDIDGIQGDDRLPALPSNGGYDEYTVNLYQSEHGGRKPPVHYKDYEWVKWRSGKLSSFLAGLVGEVRKEKPGIIISMAPSIYPWSEENYLQDWPEWMDMGLVDLIIPQVYRYDLDAYQREVDKILTRQLHPHDKGRFFPGVLLQVNDYNPSEELLEGFIAYNRQHGIPGEVFFFFEGIRKFEAYFKERYKDRPPFPSLEELAAFNGQN